jgi:membrane protein insertase Oxa1/YidC/SpoIIIJ
MQAKLMWFMPLIFSDVLLLPGRPGAVLINNILSIAQWVINTWMACCRSSSAEIR